VTVIVTVAVPDCPLTDMTLTVQAVVDVPQVEGAIVTPGDPVATSDAGINAGLELLTLKTSAPTPPTVSAIGVELDPLTTLALKLLGVILGALI
jgi:hypothetical protein